MYKRSADAKMYADSQAEQEGASKQQHCQNCLLYIFSDEWDTGTVHTKTQIFMHQVWHLRPIFNIDVILIPLNGNRGCIIWWKLASSPSLVPYLTPLCCLHLSTGDAASLSPITWMASSLQPPPLPPPPFLWEKKSDLIGCVIATKLPLQPDISFIDVRSCKVWNFGDIWFGNSSTKWWS